jgi:Fibronectin type III domain
MSIKKLHFSLLAFLIGFFANAQIFPVQVNSNIIPPYLPTVSSYATSTNQKYFVNIFTADLSVVNRPATLKFYIEGNGIQAQSTPVVTGAAPIYLNGGETLSLTNIDLAPYFQIQNLQGISPAQYANNLPQGQYNYCIEVYDAFTNQKISQKSCTFYYFLYNEPPLLNLPVNHEVQFFQDPQNLIFTWTPRHINATNIEYQFTLVELVDTNAPSNYAFAVGAPLYQTTTSNTMLLYGPTEPQMIAGRKYAWRVKAVNQPGFGEDALFNNNGFSEIYDFVYAGNCVAPTFVVSFSLSSTQAKITWQPNPDHLGYKVEYRKLNTTNWFEAANFNNEAKLFDLEPSATYEFRVGAMCIGNQITYSPINQFTQPAGNVVTLNCGLMPTVDLSNQVLYTATMPSDQVFLAGDFPIHVTEVSGTTTYTGKGWTNLPYFSFVRIQVEFKDIKVNTGMSLVDGVIKATYDPTWSNIIDINAVVGVIENAGDAFSPDTDEHSYQVDFVIPNASSIVVTDNSIVINGPAGQVITHDRDLGESVIIRDANGNVYGVGPTANSAVLLQAGAGFIPSSSNTTGVNSSGQVTAFDHTKAKVTFKRSPNGTNASKFADDERPTDNTISDKILSKYKKVNDYNYYYKGVENDGKATRSSEFIEARIETFDNTIVADSIVFNIKGSKANKIGNAVKNGNISTVTLEVPVFETVKELELLALIKKTTATGKNTVVGAAMIIPTKILPVVNVTIVPVNGATIPTNINASLQNIYKGVGVTFNTTVAANYTSTITTLQCGDSGFMANYTAEQNTFIGKYTALHPADAKQYYVFVMNNITPSRPINGFMPLHRQIGFIFPSQTSQTATSEIKTGNDITSTIAHEIGHGIFELEHPWEDFNYPKTTPATNWLMDYAQGTKLPYTHWQKMSHPKFGLYIFQSDASGEHAVDNYIVTENDAFFLAPNGRPIQLPKGSRIFTLCVDNTRISNQYLLSFGILTSGTWKYYSFSKNETFTKFNGYFQVNTSPTIQIESWKKDGNGNKIEYKFSELTVNQLKNKTQKIVFIKCRDKLNTVDLNFDTSLEHYYHFYEKDRVFGNVNYNDVSDSILAWNAESSTGLTEWDKSNLFPGNSCNPSLSETNSQASNSNSSGDITVNNAGGLPQDYVDLIINKYKNTGVTTQINIYKEGETVPTTKAINGVTLNVKVKLRLNPTVWEIIGIDPIFSFDSSSSVPDSIIICLNDKYAEYLSSLKGSSQYTQALRPKQIAMEVGLCLYNALFVVRCYFKADANDSNSEAFVRGAVFEALETIDIVQLILGSEQIVTQLAEKCATKNINFVKSVYGLTKKVVTGTLATQDTKAQVKEVLSVFLPPCVDIAMIEKGLVLADTLRSKFKENKWYNSGRIATIVVPLVITGGAYAYTKIRSLTSGLTLTTATILENTISLNEKLIAKGLYLEENAGKTLIKKIHNNEVITVEGTSLTDIEKAIDDAVLQGTESLLTKMLKNTDFKKIYDDLINGITPRRFATEISIEEEAIYKFYTNESYYKFNQTLIAQNYSEDIIELENLLNSTLNKVIPSPGIYYRGIGKQEIDMLKTFNIGDEITYKNFVSTSKDQIVTSKFIRKNIIKTGEGALIIIDSKNAKSIIKFSDAVNEVEFLHKSKSKFILDEILLNKVLNSYEVTVDLTTPIYGTIYKLKEM